MSLPATEKLQKQLDTILIVVFAAWIWLPSLDSVLKLDVVPRSDEKRNLARFPKIALNSLTEVQTFFHDFGLYYDDNFGFRNQLVRWENDWKLAFFKESTVSSVLMGRDGWLYYANDFMIENAQAIMPFTLTELRAWKALLESRRDWCLQRNAKYLFVIAPDKHSIYPEYLPRWIQRTGDQTKLDQLSSFLKANSTVPILDLRPTLIAAKKNKDVYLRTDSHWNWLGSFCGYQALVETLAEQVPGLKPLSLDAFELRLEEFTTGGDLAGLLNQKQTLLERNFVSGHPKPPLQPLVTGHHTPGNPPFTMNPDARGKAIVFRDSFSDEWIPLLGYHFNEVHYFGQYSWDKTFLEKSKPDLIIDQVVERILNRINPSQLLEKDSQLQATGIVHPAEDSQP